MRRKSSQDQQHVAKYPKSSGNKKRGKIRFVGKHDDDVIKGWFAKIRPGCDPVSGLRDLTEEDDPVVAAATLAGRGPKTMGAAWG